MKKIAIIPARYKSTRLKNKLMKKIGNKTIIRRTYEKVSKMNIFDKVLVVTDNKIIFNEIKKNKGKVLISKKKHKTGTDRIAEIAKNIKADIIFNIQGDEPFIKKKPLLDLINILKKDSKKKIDLATIIEKIKNKKNINDPNYVKVIINKKKFAIYFSRLAIPYFNKKENIKINYYKHIGVYAFHKKHLMSFSKLKQLQNEKTEKIECLRFLEHGKKIKIIITKNSGIKIDTIEDLKNAEKFLKKK